MSLSSSIHNEPKGDKTSPVTFGRGIRFAHGSRHDFKFVQPTLQRTVEERNTFRWCKADQFRDSQVGGENIGPPSAESLFQPVAQLRIEGIEFLRPAEPDSVGGIDDQHTLFSWSLEGEHVALSQANIDRDSRSLKRPLCGFDRSRVLVRGLDGCRRRCQVLQPRGFAQMAPAFGIVNKQSLKRE